MRRLEKAPYPPLISGCERGARRRGGTGTFSTDGNTITFETDSICGAVGAEQGTYTWTDENNRLTLTKQADLCEPRVGALDGVVSAQVE